MMMPPPVLLLETLLELNRMGTPGDTKFMAFRVEGKANLVIGLYDDVESNRRSNGGVV
jgi:hypothetical protein